jgi:hypothetical protein
VNQDAWKKGYAAVATVLATFALLAGCGGDDEGTDTSSTTTSSVSATGATGVAGESGHSIPEDGLEADVNAAIAQESPGLPPPESVDCPGDLRLEVDESMDCTFKVPSGEGTARVTVATVDDENYELGVEVTQQPR